VTDRLMTPAQDDVPMQPAETANGRAAAPRSPGAVRCRVGTTVVDLLVATCVALAVLGLVTLALTPVLDAVSALPEATDLHQRARAAEGVLSSVIGAAGAGADLIGESPLTHAVPALWPRRFWGPPDAPGTAWADRLTVLHVPARAAQAPLSAGVLPGASLVLLQWHAACGTHASCGFRRGDLVLLASRSGAMTLTTLAGVQGLSLTLSAAVDQLHSLPAHVTVVSSTTVFHDPTRRQLRRADGTAASQPVTDDVVGLRMRYYGNAAPPRWPAVAGTDTCAVAADGTPRLGLLGSVPGPPVELTVADLLDGPWCGSGLWRYDADLLRVRAVRLALRLQASAEAVRGRAPLWFALPGRARRPAQEVRDIELDVFVPAPNLAWGQ
jgi:hypothetical protein